MARKNNNKTRKRNFVARINVPVNVDGYTRTGWDAFDPQAEQGLYLICKLIHTANPNLSINTEFSWLKNQDNTVHSDGIVFNQTNLDDDFKELSERRNDMVLPNHLAGYREHIAKWKYCKKVVIGREVGDQLEVPHYQMFVGFKHPRFAEALRKQISLYVNWFRSSSDPEFKAWAHVSGDAQDSYQNAMDYAKKDKCFIDYGTTPSAEERDARAAHLQYEEHIILQSAGLHILLHGFLLTLTLIMPRLYQKNELLFKRYLKMYNEQGKVKLGKTGSRKHRKLVVVAGPSNCGKTSPYVMLKNQAPDSSSVLIVSAGQDKFPRGISSDTQIVVLDEFRPEQHMSSGVACQNNIWGLSDNHYFTLRSLYEHNEVNPKLTVVLTNDMAETSKQYAFIYQYALEELGADINKFQQSTGGKLLKEAFTVDKKILADNVAAYATAVYWQLRKSNHHMDLIQSVKDLRRYMSDNNTKYHVDAMYERMQGPDDVIGYINCEAIDGFNKRNPKDQKSRDSVRAKIFEITQIYLERNVLVNPRAESSKDLTVVAQNVLQLLGTGMNENGYEASVDRLYDDLLTISPDETITSLGAITNYAELWRRLKLDRLIKQQCHQSDNTINDENEREDYIDVKNMLIDTDINQDQLISGKENVEYVD